LETWVPLICIDGWVTGGRLLWAAETTLGLNELVDEVRKALKAMCIFYMMGRMESTTWGIF
jgi:hypothetical protein